MGILGNMFNRNSTATANVPTDPYSTLGSSDTLPANASLRDRLAAGGGAVVDRATQFYKQNPKLVGGLAVLAGAAILAGMKKRG